MALTCREYTRASFDVIVRARPPTTMAVLRSFVLGGNGRTRRSLWTTGVRTFTVPLMKPYPNAKLSPKKVAAFRRAIADDRSVSIMEHARRLRITGVLCERQIYRIARGKSWGSTTEKKT